MEVADNSFNRYSKQVLFAPIGNEGQNNLAEKVAVVVGCGALGSVIASTIVRAGVGTVRIIDRDFVDESNLQRQLLFDEDDANNDIPKAIAAKNRLERINSTIKIEAIISDINYSNVEELIGNADVVLDGLDNFETRFLLNDYCVKNQIPWIYGACVGSSGLSMNIVPGITPCLRCVFETPPPQGTSPTCDTNGVIAPIVNIIGSVQSCEALKILSGNIDSISKTLLSIDVWNGKYRNIDIGNRKNANDCIVCGEKRYEYLSAKSYSSSITMCGRNAVQIKSTDRDKINLKTMAERLSSMGEVKHNDFLIKLKVDGYELSLFDDGRAIIFGKEDPVTAKNL